MVNALLHHCNGMLAELGGAERPGIVHRLDKDTSGCFVVAKTEFTHKALVAQFAERSTKKQYLTVVQGVPNKQEDSIFTHIGRHPVNRLKMAVVNPGSGKTAITDYRVLGTIPENDTSLILCDLHTGRTHQIRVHMLHIGTPILADPIYANANKQKCHPGRLMLHALNLSITHPVTLKRLHFTAPIPKEYEPWVDKFPGDL
jgi:23S rRNA pseudouridine1911/1915/1917 synthase